MTMVMQRAAFVLLPVVCWLAAAGLARAEGEAALVVDKGNGEVFTFCAAFPGDSITGEGLLATAGQSVNQFSGMVCSIEGKGCTHSGSFNSCTCECQPGSGNCTYWSFFTQKYGGPMVYSSAGFRTVAAKNGDLHVWKWQSGNLSSAPAPGGYSFESVCGHKPEDPNDATPGPTISFFPPTATPDSPGQRPRTPVPAGDNPPTQAPVVTFTQPVSTLAPTSANTPQPPATGNGAETATVDVPLAKATTAQSTSTSAPLPPSAGDDNSGGDDDEGGSGMNMGLVMFGVIALGLAGAIGGAMLRGRRS